VFSSKTNERRGLTLTLNRRSKHLWRTLIKVCGAIVEVKVKVNGHISTEKEYL